MIEKIKKNVALNTLSLFSDLLEESGIIGLGTGSTIKYFVEYLVKTSFLTDKKLCVSSYDTLFFLRRLGYMYAYTPILCPGTIDVYIDGFDEADKNMDIIKGRGAAMAWEKKLALTSKTRIYIADYTKYNGRDYLYMKPLPIEISPSYIDIALKELEENGLIPIIRMGKRKDGPVITDNNNFVVDVYYDKITEAADLEKILKNIRGVVETGLFPKTLVDYVVLGYPHGKIKILGKD